MIPNKKRIILILTVIFLQACSSLEEFDRVAEVTELSVEPSPHRKAINEGRNLILEGK